MTYEDFFSFYHLANRRGNSYYEMAFDADKLSEKDKEILNYKKEIMELWTNIERKHNPIHSLLTVFFEERFGYMRGFDIPIQEKEKSIKQCLKYARELYGNSPETIEAEKELVNCLKNPDAFFEKYAEYEDAYKKLTGKDSLEPVLEDNVEEIYLDFLPEEPEIKITENIDPKSDSSISEMSIEELEALAEKNQQIIDKNDEDITKAQEEQRKAELIEKIKQQQETISKQNLTLAELAEIKPQNKEDIGINE